MPYFKWKGVNLVGDWHHGRLFSRTEQELDSRLIEQDIALVKCRQTRIWFAPRIGSHSCVQLFSGLATLCDAGILLPNALEIVGMQLNNPRLQSVVISLSDAIKNGFAPHDAFAQYPHLFDSFSVGMIQVGHQSGTMPQVLLLLSKHLQNSYEFSRKIKTALIGPLCTVVVFMLVTGIMFIHIVPSFASLFLSVGHDIPELTRIMLSVSEWMVSWQAVWMLVILFMSISLFWFWLRTSRGCYWRDKHLVRLPFVGKIVQFQSLNSFFRSLSLLLQGGSSLVPALTMASNATKNRYIKEKVSFCGEEVQSGRSLTNALRSCSFNIGILDLLYMIQVGERSGKLSLMLERVSTICEQRAADRLSTIHTLVQPTIMIALGLLVSLLIFAIYVPLFNLSDVIAL